MTAAVVAMTRSRTPFGRYVAASVGLMAIATANGVLREKTYGRRMSDDAAHRISFVPMVVLFAAYVNALEKRWPLPTWRGAVAVGAAWAAIAAGFEVDVGHYVDRRSWSELLGEYDVTAGRPGGFVLVASASLPAVVRLGRLRRASP